MADAVRWLLAALLIAAFVAINVTNVRLVLGRYQRPDGTNPSPVLFVGGIAGILALVIAPMAIPRGAYWLPILLDLGSGPYVAMVVIAILHEQLTKGRAGSGKQETPKE